MAKFSLYKVSLKNLSQGKHVFTYDLDKKFFDSIDGEEVRKGDVSVELTLKKTVTTYEFNFDIKGVVQIPCDRCLDEMEQEIDTKNRLIVKLGKEYSEENDEIIIIPEDEGKINIAWFLYEFIVLNIPMKHVHEQGKCNKTMTSKLRKHRAISSNDNNEGDDDFDEDDDLADDNADDDNSDPRWDALKNLKLED